MKSFQTDNFHANPKQKKMFMELFIQARAFFNTIKMVVGMYLFWILAHYVASHLYVTWCLPFTVGGFLLSPFMTATPHCQALRWTIGQGGQTISVMWLVLGGWLSERNLFQPHPLPPVE